MHHAPTFGIVLLAALAALPVRGQTAGDLARQVRDAEQAFANTMARRDVEAFATFIADEAVFFGQQAIRGKTAVVEAWSPFFQTPEAPFAWQPESVEVLESGTLALSTGPVFDPQGRRIGTFNSVWRLEPDGRWRVVFDKGCPPL